MLTPELQKLKEYLEGTRDGVNKKKLLEELKLLDETEMEALFESLSLSSGVCPACGRKW